jgi:hypothetical protein
VTAPDIPDRVRSLSYSINPLSRGRRFAPPGGKDYFRPAFGLSDYVLPALNVTSRCSLPFKYDDDKDGFHRPCFNLCQVHPPSKCQVG